MEWSSGTTVAVSPPPCSRPPLLIKPYFCLPPSHGNRTTGFSVSSAQCVLVRTRLRRKGSRHENSSSRIVCCDGGFHRRIGLCPGSRAANSGVSSSGCSPAGGAGQELFHDRRI